MIWYRAQTLVGDPQIVSLHCKSSLLGSSFPTQRNPPLFSCGGGWGGWGEESLYKTLAAGTLGTRFGKVTGKLVGRFARSSLCLG